MSNVVVNVAGLAKTFQVKQKAAGLGGSVRSLWRQEVREVTAVSDIAFSLEKGEMLAFIGPNGAGKSTTIKMLTGILYPSAGQASVLGYTPWKDRRKLGYHIGSVFGQKPQLWYHLPAEDTFRLFARIYELDMGEFQQRRDFLVESFQIGDLLQTPVRKLSLGQRMKCEIAASLLHRPRIIFLDEPTSGVDPITRNSFWETIKTMAAGGVTVFVTTHYMDEAENCDRMALIYRGTIIAMGSPMEMKTRCMTDEVMELQVPDAESWADAIRSVPGVRETALFGSGIHAVVEKADIVGPRIRAALDAAGVGGYALDRIVPSLEDVFVSLIETYDAREGEDRRTAV